MLHMALLPKYARGRFDVISVPELAEDGQKVSSTRIRHALDSRDIDTANDFLGYTYTTAGRWFMVRRVAVCWLPNNQFGDTLANSDYQALVFMQ